MDPAGQIDETEKRNIDALGEVMEALGHILGVGVSDLYAGGTVRDLVPQESRQAVLSLLWKLSSAPDHAQERVAAVLHNQTFLSETPVRSRAGKLLEVLRVAAAEPAPVHPPKTAQEDLSAIFGHKDPARPWARPYPNPLDEHDFPKAFFREFCAAAEAAQLAVLAMLQDPRFLEETPIGDRPDAPLMLVLFALPPPAPAPQTPPQPPGSARAAAPPPSAAAATAKPATPFQQLISMLKAGVGRGDMLLSDLTHPLMRNFLALPKVDQRTILSRLELGNRLGIFLDLNVRERRQWFEVALCGGDVGKLQTHEEYR